MRRFMLVFIVAMTCGSAGEAAAPPTAAPAELTLREILKVGGKELPVLILCAPMPLKLIGFQLKSSPSK